MMKLQEFGKGIGSSKKIASQLAAEKALQKIKNEHPFVDTKSLN